MTRLCSISAATVLFFISGLSSSATAQQAPTMKTLLSIVGKDSLVRAEAVSAAKWLLGKSAAEAGVAARVDRTVRITPLGDITVDPPYRVPLFKLRNTPVEFDLKSIPIGKVLGGGAVLDCAAEACRKNPSDANHGPDHDFND